MPFANAYPRLRLAGLALTGAALFSVSPLAAQTPAPQRAEIEKIVREYLLANPELLAEMQSELEQRQTERLRVAQREALKSEQDALLKSPNAPVVGNPNGDVTVVEFMDYNCGFCKRSVGDLQAMLKADPKLRLVLKIFPVLGPDSLEAGQVALAVQNQLKGDKFWSFHTQLMETRGRVGRERALEVAREAGVDMARLERDLANPAIRQTLEGTMELADKLSLTGTPAYVIGDEVVFGAVGRPTLTRTVANVRACGKATC